MLTYGFATSMDSTGSSQNRDERLRRRREQKGHATLAKRPNKGKPD